MCKFIEVTRKYGEKIMLNISQIESVSIMNTEVAIKYGVVQIVPESVHSRIYLLSSNDYDPHYDVEETYDQIKAMLM